MSRQRLWIISELFYPEQTSTGYFLTEIARGLASENDIHVLCGQPSYSERGVKAPRAELWNGIKIIRLISTHFDKDKIILRLLNALTFTLSCIIYILLRLKRGDSLLIVTNPPFLYPFVIAICKLKCVKTILLVHDVYPDILHATGILKRSGPAYKILDKFFAVPMRWANIIVVLGRDMRHLIAGKVACAADKILIIPNWGDCDEIRPIARSDNPFATQHDITSQTVIQFSGNIGRTHDVATILGAARRSKNDNSISYMFIGYGGGTDLVLESIAMDLVSNVKLLPRQPRQMLGPMLSSATAVVVSFNSDMLGLSVPSRMYNVMAAGTPIIAMADPASELSLIVREEDCGWVVPLGDENALTDLVAWLNTQEGESERNRKGKNARDCVERRFRYEHIVSMYKKILVNDHQSSR